MYNVRLEGAVNAFITDITDSEYTEYYAIDGGAFRYQDSDELVGNHDPELAEHLQMLSNLVELEDEFETVEYTANWHKPHDGSPVRWRAESIVRTPGESEDLVLASSPSRSQQLRHRYAVNRLYNILFAGQR